MSGVKVVRYLLANNAPLLAVVPAPKIMAGTLPLNTVLPAIGIKHISTVENGSVAMDSASLLTTSRIQVTALAKTYAEQAAILELVRKALPLSHATVNGIVVDGILPDGAGPDFEDNDATIYAGSRDFIVKFQKAA